MADRPDSSNRPRGGADSSSGPRGGADSSNGSRSGLPLRGAQRPPRQIILASHLIFTGYAHWLPNDPRGSGSSDIRKDELKPLGDILIGRQFPQPPREIVKQFQREAEPKLEHERIWFKEAHRDAVAKAFAEVATARGYAFWACAICSNHAHAVVRTPRDRAEAIWTNLAQRAAEILRQQALVPPDHPAWSHRPYKVFLRSEQDVNGRIAYVNENPVKEGLPRQAWSFVKDF
jgi:REP element-mobilizing transposase RayT